MQSISFSHKDKVNFCNEVNGEIQSEDEISGELDCFDLHTIAFSDGKNKSSNNVLKNVLINGKNVKMAIETCAVVSVMASDTYTNLFGNFHPVLRRG